MKIQSIVPLLSLGALTVGLSGLLTARAGTVAWYRFEEGGTNYNVVTNVVDSGTNSLHGVVNPPGLLRYAPARGAYPAGGASALALFGAGHAILPNPSGIDLDHGIIAWLAWR
jgi:hypothetical protein